MSKNFWNQYPHQQNWWPQSPSSDVMLESQLEQIRSLGRIEAKVENLQDRQGNLETKLDNHIESCQPSRRRKVVSFEGLKENWTLVLLGVQVVVFLALQMVGQPDKAQQVWGSSPGFQQKSGEE